LSKSYRKNLLLIVLGLLFITGSDIEAREPGVSLREASKLYQAQNYQQAIQIAEKTLEYSQNNVEAMLIAAMSHFNNHDYAKSRTWLRKIIKLKPSHPIAKEYIRLIQELEHRFGPFKSDMLDSMQAKDPIISGEAFKRGWFGPSFPKESDPIRPGSASTLPTHGISSSSSPVASSSAKIALEVDPPLERVLAEKTVAKLAKDAFEQELYLKSYLFYSQLAAHNPKNRSYLIKKAQSAFHMKRYSEVVKTLGPIMLGLDQQTFPKQEYEAAKKLLEDSRKKLYE
jgi:tetratricopeptide (TPR) repeat protein